MPSSTIAVPLRAEARVQGRPGRRAHSRPPKLIDTRLVQSELARLRAPRPATEVLSARITRSTLPGV